MRSYATAQLIDPLYLMTLESEPDEWGDLASFREAAAGT